DGFADLAIALLPPQPGAGGRGIVVGAARRAIQSLTGWTPTQPLSGMRCLTREAFEAATPLARGWGVATGMTVDPARQGSVAAARRAIQSLTGWTPTQPLSGMRCLTREAFEAATPLARGWGVETGMTIDLLRKGYVAVEVPCDLRHRASSNDLKGQLHRAAQYRDVLLAVNARKMRSAVDRVRAGDH